MTKKKKSCMAAVYFDQPTGAPYAICWLKSVLAFKNWLRPANRMPNTCLLVEIHNTWCNCKYNGNVHPMGSNSKYISTGVFVLEIFEINFTVFFVFLFTLAYFPGTRSPAVGPAPCGVQVPLYSTLYMMPCCVALGPVFTCLFTGKSLCYIEFWIKLVKFTFFSCIFLLGSWTNSVLLYYLI